MIYKGEKKDRPAYIQGLRDLADWLEATPDVPITSGGTDLQISTHGTDEQMLSDLEDMAIVFGVASVDPYGDGTHRHVARQFGPIKYYVHFSTEAWAKDFAETQRLGREAMAQAKREGALPEYEDDDLLIDVGSRVNAYEVGGLCKPGMLVSFEGANLVTVLLDGATKPSYAGLSSLVPLRRVGDAR